MISIQQASGIINIDCIVKYSSGFTEFTRSFCRSSLIRHDDIPGTSFALDRVFLPLIEPFPIVDSLNERVLFITKIFLFDFKAANAGIIH